LMAHRTGKSATIAAVARIVVIADFLFTATAVVLQPITGVALTWLDGYSLGEGWILAVYRTLSGHRCVLAAGPLDADPHARSRCCRGENSTAFAARISSLVPRLVRVRLPGVRRNLGDLLADGDASDDQASDTLMCAAVAITAGGGTGRA
jgi:hypothetical protein